MKFPPQTVPPRPPPPISIPPTPLLPRESVTPWLRALQQEGQHLPSSEVSLQEGATLQSFSLVSPRSVSGGIQPPLAVPYTSLVPVSVQRAIWCPGNL